MLLVDLLNDLEDLELCLAARVMSEGANQRHKASSQGHSFLPVCFDSGTKQGNDTGCHSGGASLN